MARRRPGSAFPVTADEPVGIVVEKAIGIERMRGGFAELVLAAHQQDDRRQQGPCRVARIGAMQVASRYMGVEPFADRAYGRVHHG